MFFKKQSLLCSFDGKAEFSSASHNSSLQCHMILQKSFWYAELLLKKHFIMFFQKARDRVENGYKT